MGFLLIVPGLAVFLAIILYPFVDAVFTSFTDRSLLYPTYQVVGIQNCWRWSSGQSPPAGL